MTPFSTEEEASHDWSRMRYRSYDTLVELGDWKGPHVFSKLHDACEAQRPFARTTLRHDEQSLDIMFLIINRLLVAHEERRYEPKI